MFLFTKRCCTERNGAQALGYQLDSSVLLVAQTTYIFLFLNEFVCHIGGVKHAYGLVSEQVYLCRP